MTISLHFFLEKRAIFLIFHGKYKSSARPKKIESKNSDLALNSSYPKNKLFADNPMLTKACQDAENWTVKDMLYAVGVVQNGQLNALAFVYGDDYCASSEIYENIKQRIKLGVETIEGVEFTPTKELGKVKRIDPLGITNLCVRGMWHIENPFRVFEYVYQRDFNRRFNFMALIGDDKWQSFENTHQLQSVIDGCNNASIRDVQIKNPNNPAQLKSAKLIEFWVV